VEAIERSRIRHQAGALGFEDLPDRPVAVLGMSMRFGIGDTLIEQPGIQLVIALHP
jgi:hypothetical protein